MRRPALAVALALVVAAQWTPHAVVAASATLQTSAPQQQAPAAQAPAQLAERLRAFEEVVRRQMEADGTTGLTVGFVKDGATWVRAFGHADVENKTPMKPESAYRLASVTKPMTALAVLQLAERGKLNLDAEVQTYLPYFPKKQWPVTVRQLLGHLGGITHYKDAATELHIKDRKPTRDAIAIFEKYDLVAEPGTRYQYSSYGYNLLGAVVEAASGQSFGDYMRENVWRPLGMTDTRMDDPLDIIPNRVRGYQRVNGQLKNSEFIDISSRFAAGGTRSTVPDLLKFAEGLMARKLLSKDGYEQMFTSMQTREGRLTDYGAGWETGPVSGRFMVAHSGGQNETRTWLVVFPSRNFALAGAVNFENSSPEWYMTRLFQILTGEPMERTAYTGDRTKDMLFAGMNSAFSAGLAYFERHRQPLAKTDAEAAQAFAYFNGAVNEEALRSAQQQETWQKVRAGRHPSGNFAFTKVGSLMAARLGEKHGAARLDSYAGAGAINFFHDYVTMYKSQPGYPKELQFTEAFEKTVGRWQEGWARANTEQVRQLAVSPALDLDGAGQILRRSFAGAEVFPNLVDDFGATVRQLSARGDGERALKAARLAHDLYPASDAANVYLGVVQLLFGGGGDAAALIRKAKEMNPNGAASAGSLNAIAYEVASIGKIDAGLQILTIASELYPQEANLFDSLGEFHLRKGERERAIAFYRKALEVDPKFENAKRVLERLEK